MRFLALLLVASAAPPWLEGHACLAIRHRQPDTTQQVLPFQEADVVHDRKFDGSWTCIALVGASATHPHGGAQTYIAAGDRQQYALHIGFRRSYSGTDHWIYYWIHCHWNVDLFSIAQQYVL
jgi:hypothetical protein